MMDTSKIEGLFQKWFAESLGDDFGWLLTHRPLLAHYTSITAMENILKSEEVWLSNPLLMNDIEEMQFGINVALDLFIDNQDIKQMCRSSQIYQKITDAFFRYINAFERDHALDVYVFCFSEHDRKDKDGLLSMWRGYGGQGSGAALVFNTTFVDVTGESPLIISRVDYLSREQRVQALTNKITSFCDVLKSVEVSEDYLHITAYYFFQLVVLTALTTKHWGFREEREWRLVYLPHHDPSGLLKDCFGYAIGPHGVEPKLKLPILTY